MSRSLAGNPSSMALWTALPSEPTRREYEDLRRMAKRNLSQQSCCLIAQETAGKPVAEMLNETLSFYIADDYPKLLVTGHVILAAQGDGHIIRFKATQSSQALQAPLSVICSQRFRFPELFLGGIHFLSP